ncbi:MAG: S8/S53 family peptidase [Gammaproteobacteria bacterium]|nr:MAG: S8/S53 family peptidase [Gammaproteobacteria bacterium]
MLTATAAMGEGRALELLDFTVESCRGWPVNGAPVADISDGEIAQSDIVFRQRQIGTRFRLPVAAGGLFELDVLDRTGRPMRFVGKAFNDFGDPLLLVVLSNDCMQQVARRIEYAENSQAIRIVTLNEEWQPRGEPEWLNPPLEFVERPAAKPLKHPGEATPLRVGMVDSGVNYRLPEINRRLARDAGGQLIGYDFWDMDLQPFDAHPVDSGFFVQRHGTRTASLLLREAPGIELVPYRYPRPNMTRMHALIEHADDNGVGILGMPLGSNRPEDWIAFADSARAHPHMLFIVSAGNDGRDIDEHPVYPAALGLDNLLVVTSADDFVSPAPRTNWGRLSVDYLLPAERVEVIDFDGRPTLASGSSYAVARLTALVARMKMQRPYLRAADIVAELEKKYGNVSGAALDWVGSGYIADPLAGAPVRKSLLAKLDPYPALTVGDLSLPLEVLRLDASRSQAQIKTALSTAFGILAQCGIAPGDVTIHAVEAADYLRDLSTGSARTLLEAVGVAGTTVVFARDTRMQAAYTGEAFGLANTSMRPWLANSVWLMRDVDDPGIALAHELYHVLANSGEHVTDPTNLMLANTRPDGTRLTPQQCERALKNGVANGLLFE